MSIHKLFLTQTGTSALYPSFFSRFLFCLISTISVLDFHYLDTGKDVSEGNYWLAKGAILICTVLVIEGIYWMHLWVCDHWNYGIGLLFVFQMIFSALLPSLLIIKVLGLFGIGALSYWESISIETNGSLALIYETMMITITTFLLCKIGAPLLFFPKVTKPDEVQVYSGESVVNLKITEIIAIVKFHGRNVAFKIDGRPIIMVDNDPLDQLFKLLPSDSYELKQAGIFKKYCSSIKETHVTIVATFFALDTKE